MNRLHFKFGFFLGFLITINAANIFNIFYNIATDASLIWVFNGVVAVLLMFVHAIWCDEIFNESE